MHPPGTVALRALPLPTGLRWRPPAGRLAGSRSVERPARPHGSARGCARACGGHALWPHTLRPKGAPRARRRVGLDELAHDAADATVTVRAVQCGWDGNHDALSAHVARQRVPCRRLCPPMARGSQRRQGRVGRGPRRWVVSGEPLCEPPLLRRRRRCLSARGYARTRAAQSARSAAALCSTVRRSSSNVHRYRPPPFDSSTSLQSPASRPVCLCLSLPSSLLHLAPPSPSPRPHMAAAMCDHADAARSITASRPLTTLPRWPRSSNRRCTRRRTSCWRRRPLAAMR